MKIYHVHLFNLLQFGVLVIRAAGFSFGHSSQSEATNIGHVNKVKLPHIDIVVTKDTNLFRIQNLVTDTDI